MIACQRLGSVTLSRNQFAAFPNDGPKQFSSICVSNLQLSCLELFNLSLFNLNLTFMAEVFVTKDKPYSKYLRIGTYYFASEPGFLNNEQN